MIGSLITKILLRNSDTNNEPIRHSFRFYLAATGFSCEKISHERKRPKWRYQQKKCRPTITLVSCVLGHNPEAAHHNQNSRLLISTISFDIYPTTSGIIFPRIHYKCITLLSTQPTGVNTHNIINGCPQEKQRP